MPSIYIDMSKMETGPIAVSRNGWEKRQGASSLLQAGSQVANAYWFFTGRTELEYTFHWNAQRPVSDFAGFHMLLQLDGAEGKLTFPDGIWVSSTTVAEGNKRTVTFQAVAKANEVGYLAFSDLSNSGSSTQLSVRDSANISNIVQTAVFLQYQTAENGQYGVRYNAYVPAEALTTNAQGFSIALDKLGLNPDYTKIGTQAYMSLTVTRSLGSGSARYSLAQYATIVLALKAGDAVEPTADSDMLTGNQVVDHVRKGEKCRVTKLQGDWVALEKIDGTPIKGWLQRSRLALSLSVHAASQNENDVTITSMERGE